MRNAFKISFAPSLIILASLSLAAVGLASSRAAAPIPITFWHYIGQESGSKIIADFAREFNASQAQYAVKVVEPGDFKTIQIKLQAALASKGEVPNLVQIDNGFFTRLAVGGALNDLTGSVKTLPKATLEDYDPTFWEYGDVSGKRYGLPWAGSTLVQFYNVDAFKQKGLPAPRSWDEYTRAAKALTSRSAKGAIFFTDGWVFASMVSSRGGNILDAQKRPDFDSDKAVQSLQMMYDLSKGGQAIVRSFSEANFAVIDWVRTKAFLVTLPTSAYSVVKGSISFQVGAVPMPGKTLAGESQLVIPRGNSTEETAGAVAFWSYLTRPENTARFSKATYYLPVRQSAKKLLGDFANDPVMKAGLEALDNSYNPPRLKLYNDWRGVLEAQLERSLKGGVDPKAALIEAQRQALQLK